MRIFYLCPDFNRPSGGVRRLYRHVEVLRQEGFEAYIMHSRSGFKPSWFLHDVPIVYSCDSSQLNRADVVVIPEGAPSAMKQISALPVKKVVIALSSSYIFPDIDTGKNWGDYGIKWVMTNSKITKDFIQWSMNIENIYLIGSSFDRDLCYYDPAAKRQKVAYLKRKDTFSPVIEKILKSRNHCFCELEFRAIENLSLEDYTAALRETQIFLTTSAAESFPLCFIEAMACGCVCIGFDGIGCKEFIVDS